MKKIIAIVLLLACCVGLLACKAKNNDENGEEKILGEISEAAPGGSAYWAHADEAVLSELNAQFDAKKALSDGFYDIGKITGTTYYVSSVNGKDTNNGKSPSSAWKTLDKIAGASLSAGDAVLFECGSEFRISSTFQLRNGVTYASYGSGEKPVFLGSVSASKTSDWKAVSGVKNLYEYVGDASITTSDGTDVGSIILDGGKAWGIKIQKLDDANKSLELLDVSNGEAHFDKIASFNLSSGADLGKNGKYDLSFYCYGIDLYFYCKGGNPAERFSSIELSRDFRMFSGNNISDVTIANINFKNSGRFAIRTEVCKNLAVYNCGFEFIGGVVQGHEQDFGRNWDTRLGNAIENWGSCDGMIVESCYFNQIYDTAMTTQSNDDGTDMINIAYNNNVIENVVYAIELWSSGAEGASCDFKNVSIDGNVCRNIGYGFTTQRPDKVSGFLSAKGSYYVYENAVMKNNVINGSIDWLLRTNNVKTNDNGNGYVMDGNIYVNALGNDIGMLSSSFPKYSKEISEYTYTFDNINKLRKAGVEPNGKFYFTASEKNADLLGDELLNAYAIANPSYTYTVEGGEEIPFRVLLPVNYDETKEYKLFTYLNNEYANGTDNFKNVQVHNKLLADVYTSGEYIVLVPQCPAESWTGLAVNNGNYSVSSTDESGVMKSVYGLINDISVKYKTTDSLAAGVSTGGYALADLIARHDGLLTAAVIIGGAGDTQASAGDTKVWIIHGEGDEKISAADARALAEAWGAEYTEMERELHDCWKMAFTKEDIVGWLGQQ